MCENIPVVPELLSFFFPTTNVDFKIKYWKCRALITSSRRLPEGCLFLSDSPGGIPGVWAHVGIMTQLLYLAYACFAILYLVWAIASVQSRSDSWSRGNPPLSPCPGYLLWLRQNRKAVFNQASPVNMMEKATIGSVTLGYMGQCHLVGPCFPTAEQPGAESQPCLLFCSVTSPWLHCCVAGCSLLNLLILYPSATPTSLFSPFSHFFGLFYSSLPLFLLYL